MTIFVNYNCAFFNSTERNFKQSKANPSILVIKLGVLTSKSESALAKVPPSITLWSSLNTNSSKK